MNYQDIDLITSQIEHVWSAEQEILDVIHAFCKKHNLRYSLAYGTLLGAVRHHGFIPWDDDIDLIMPREDYSKLIQLWSQEVPSKYLLLNYYNAQDYTNNFTKIVKDHTTFLQSETQRSKHYHKGIFVDIFPADRIAPGRITGVMQYIACAVNLLYTREYTSGTGGLIGLTERILLGLPKAWHLPLRNFAEKQMCRWNGHANTAYIVPCTIRGCKHYYPSDSFDKISSVEFNSKSYCAFKDPDKILRTVYGDYMQLPPEEERVWHHHPILIDFEHNYEELSL